ncbi:unnamed protein product [Pieris macdunnoughi]|uniref:Uncharacterized protein n=1 Tax=Pieris macdunnoughi TaxID=345717 RepID=A0A821STN4_9NEOP|nr:unnamed protein product [Pieris macdunnoughi]
MFLSVGLADDSKEIASRERTRRGYGGRDLRSQGQGPVLVVVHRRRRRRRDCRRFAQKIAHSRPLWTRTPHRMTLEGEVARRLRAQTLIRDARHADAPASPPAPTLRLSISTIALLSPHVRRR